MSEKVSRLMTISSLRTKIARLEADRDALLAAAKKGLYWHENLNAAVDCWTVLRDAVAEAEKGNQ